MTLMALVISYLIGCIPTGLIVGRVARGIDIREHGSGNIGASNVLRVLGKRLGIFVLFLDMLKGLVPSALLPWMLGMLPVSSATVMLIGAAAVVGHMFPVFLGFKGGKGVATSVGVYLAVAPLQISIMLLYAVALISVTGYISLASVTSAVLLTILLQLYGVGTVVVTVTAILSVLIMFLHTKNLDRLLAGTESRIWDKKPQQEDDAPIVLATERRTSDH